MTNLLNKFDTNFISFIKPGERYINASFDQNITELFQDQRIKIISCNSIFTDSSYNFNSISPYSLALHYSFSLSPFSSASISFWSSYLLSSLSTFRNESI